MTVEALLEKLRREHVEHMNNADTYKQNRDFCYDRGDYRGGIGYDLARVQSENKAYDVMCIIKEIEKRVS